MNRPVYIITGLMGSGKSTLSNYLRLRHFAVAEMDLLAKFHAKRDDSLKLSLLINFGKDSLDAFGNVNIDYIKSVYFKPEFDTQREQFEYDLDYHIAKAFKEDIRYDDYTGPLFVEIPSFNGKRFNRVCNMFLGDLEAIINVETDFKIREERLKKRGLEQNEIDLRNRLQSDMSLIQNRPEYVRNFISIQNNGTQEELYDKLTLVMENLFDEPTKENIYHDYMRKMPPFVHENRRCYVFYNSTGCGSCPTPCKSSDKHFEETVKSHLKKVQDD